MEGLHSKNELSAENRQERQDIAWWIVGFVDGEGTFSVSIFRNRTTKLGWQVFPEFVITQSEESLSSLMKIKEFFNCGRVYVNRRYDNHHENLYRFCVRAREELEELIVPFFESYQLKTAKRDDFEKFKLILSMMAQGKHLARDGINEIAQIVEKMNQKKKSQYLESSETIRQDSSS